MKLPALHLTRWHIDAAAALLVGVLGASFYFLLLRPRFQQEKTAQSEHTQLAAQQTELADLRTSRRDAEMGLEAVRARLQNGAVRLEPRSRLNQRLADLTELAGTSGLQIESLAAGKSADGPKHGSVVLHFSGHGPYRSCVGFLTDVWKKYPDTAVITLAASSNPEIPVTPVALTIDLLWFTAPGGSPAPK